MYFIDDDIQDEYISEKFICNADNDSGRCMRSYPRRDKQCPKCSAPNPEWKPSRLYPYAWSELEGLPRRKYLIKGVLDCQTLSVIYGESNTGKTFFALDMAVHIALGWPWRGKRIKQGAVVYIAAEGGIGLQERLDAFRLHHGLDEYAPFHVIPVSVDLCTENNDADALIENISHIENIKLVVVDTLSRAMAGGNENGSEDMTAFIRHCDMIKERTAAHVLIVHHNGKDHSKGARGLSSLRAAVDTEIELRREQGTVIAEVKKQRDGATGENFAFTLQSYEVAKDEDGEPIYSCAIVPQDFQSGKERLKGQAQNTYRILCELLVDKGIEHIPKKGMKAQKVVRLDDFKDYFTKAGIANSDKPDSILKAFSRQRNSLKTKGYIAEWDSYIWLMDKQDKAGQTE